MRRARRVVARLSGLAVVALFGLGGAAAQAEQIVATLSHDHVFITSNFAGTDLALFGSIERDGGTVARVGDYSIVVTVRGPRGIVTVREKLARGPFWLNLDQRKYIATPAFIEILSNKPLDQIATPEQRQKSLLGIEPLVPRQGASDRPDDPEFRDALIRLRRQQSLFREDAKGVALLKADLFKATIRIPGTAPLGAYDVDVAIFSDGLALGRTALKFDVNKGGAEQRIAAYARESALTYGLAVVALALVAGWLASVIFRRD